MKFTKRLATGALVAALALSGCSGGEDSQATDELTFGIAQLQNTWQQQLSTDWHTSQVWTQLVETLVYVDDAGEVHPWLAKSWEQAPDGKSLTITVRDGVTFSDGEKLDAAALAKNIEFLFTGDEKRGITPVGLFPTDAFDHVDVVDDSTVELVLKRPQANIIGLFSLVPTGIVSPKTIDLSLEEQNKLENLAATGAYVFDSEVPNKEVVLTAREDWNWPYEGAKHDEAQIKKIRFTVISDNNVRQGALTSGQADLIQYVQPTEEERLEEEGFTVNRIKYFGADYALQLRKTAWGTREKAVRQAIQHGIDRQELLDTLYNDGWEKSVSIFNGNVFGVVDLSQDFAYDPDESNRLLDEAGWTERNSEGVRVKDGKPLVLSVYPSVYITTSKPELQLIAQQLGKIGIKVEIKGTDFATYNTQANQDSVPWFEIHWTFGDPGAARGWWSKNGQNQFRAEDPKLEELLEKSNTVVEDDARKQVLADLQKHIIDEAYLIPLHDIYQTFGARPGLENWNFTSVGRVLVSQIEVTD